MGGSAMPLLVVPLHDGTEARLTATTLTLGERELAVGRISVARQVSPNPVTIALLVAGTGMVECQPRRAEDGAVLLEALFRLRPDLRTPGFEPPATMPPGFVVTPLPPASAEALYAPSGAWQGTGGPAIPGYPTSGYPATGYPSAPPAAPYPPSGEHQAPLEPREYHAAYGPPTGYRYPYAIAPLAAQPSDGRLGRYPRTSAQVMGAILAIYFSRLLKWLGLALLAALVPAALGAVWSNLLGYAIGIDPTLPVELQQSTNGLLTYTQNGHPIAFGADTQRLLQYGAIALGAYLLSQLFLIFQRATLAAGTRGVVLGRGLRLDASLRSGLRRFFPVLGTTILLGLVMLVMLAVEAACFGTAYVGLSAAGTGTGGAASSPLVLAGTVGGILLLPIFGIWVYLWGRLLLAPYIAATEPISGPRALARSWRLTRRNWWHTVVPIVFALVFAQVVMFFAAAVFSLAVASVLVGQVLSVIVAALVAPLGDIASTSALYNLRLRAEGYSAVVGESVPPTGPASGSAAVAASPQAPAQPDR